MKIYKGYRILKDGTLFNKNGTLKKPTMNNNGYLVVDLFDKGVREKWFIHRLIATLFVSNPNNYNIVHHKDNNKQNNNYMNLEWTTSSFNNKKAYDDGLKQGIPNHKFNAKLTVKDVRKIKQMLKNDKVNQALLARKFGVSRSTINKIKSGEVWRDVS